MKARLYYEGHITLEPPLVGRLPDFLELCERLDLRVSTFQMFLPGGGVPDAFASMRDTVYATILARMGTAHRELSSAGFVVKRLKIEDAMLDTKHGDSFP